MKLAIALTTILLLTSCVGNVNSSKLVLSEPNDSVSVRTLTHQHELHITDNRMLVYNNQEKFLVPEGQVVLFESNGSDEPVFTLVNKNGRHINFTFDL